MLEEYGHYLDSLINPIDSAKIAPSSPAAIVQGVELSSQELESLRAEDDTAVVNLDGESVAIEQANEPSADEQYMLELLNRMRINPAADLIC